ncbi:MAG: site-specific integrase [Pigmentiphaga sp.]
MAKPKEAVQGMTGAESLPEGRHTVHALTQSAQAASTRRSYAQAVRHFEQHGGRIGGDAKVLAEYLAAFAGTLAVATLEHRLIAIHRAHIERGLPSPAQDRLVRRTMQGIRRAEGRAQRRVQALVKDDLLELLVAVARQKPVKAARDKALLLIGFAGAFRRSELVALDVEDITGYPHGLELLIRRSKTDQEASGRTVFIPLGSSEDRCPVAALAHWREVAGIESGPLFRAVSRYDTLLRESRLTPQSVALIVKAAMRVARGQEASQKVSGHSLRAGFVTEAATIGLRNSAIMGQTGHKSLEMVYRYIRPVHRRQLTSLL